MKERSAKRDLQKSIQREAEEEFANENEGGTIQKMDTIHKKE